MLALSVHDHEYVFVFSQGEDIGLVRLGDIWPSRAATKATLLFAGDASRFEILRPSLVEKLFGAAELRRLQRKYGVPENSDS